jgi:hypothetical protein
MAKINIREIDEEIKRLEELKRFMADPKTAALIKRMVSTNGNGAKPQSPSVEESSETQSTVTSPSAGRGTLYDAAEKAVRSLNMGVFTFHELVSAMESQGYAFQAKDKTVAANGAIKRLIAHNVIVRVEEGSAGKPAKYRLL